MDRENAQEYDAAFFAALPAQWTDKPDEWRPSQRQAAAKKLAQFLATKPFTDELRDIVRCMASDAAPTVRREATELFPVLPDDIFTELAGLLGSDPNEYVRTAARRAVERRGKGNRRNSRLRREVLGAQERFGDFKEQYGSRASCRARRMANELFEALVGATLHDFKGFLPALRLDLDMLRQHFDTGKSGPAQCKSRLEKMCHQVDQVRLFIDDLRVYAKAKPKHRVNAWVRKLLDEAVEMARERVDDSTGVEIAIDAPADLRAPLFEDMAVTAVMHLVRNAIEALKESLVTPNKKIVIHARKNPQGVLAVNVNDNGPGIDAQTLDDLRMFVPGKTTKPRKGTGLGLPTAHRYAEAHGGCLAIESQIGKGSTFTLTLPAKGEDEA